MSSKFEKLLDFLHINKTVKEYFWTDIIDHDKGTYVQIYIPSENLVYHGMVGRHEEKDGDIYLALRNYLVKDYDNNVIEDYRDNDQEWVMIKTSAVSRIELTFSPDSVKL